MAAEQSIVVADAENPAGLFDIRPGSESLQLVHEIVDGVDVAVRRGEQVGADGLTSELLGVGMAIDEAGHQRLAGEVHRPRRLSLVGLLDLGPRADRQDRPALDRQGLGVGLCVIHGDDGATDVDDIRHDCRTGGIASRSQQRKDEHRQERPDEVHMIVSNIGSARSNGQAQQRRGTLSAIRSAIRRGGYSKHTPNRSGTPAR